MSKTDMKGLAAWSFFHLLHWAVLYCAFFVHIPGAMYLLKFAIWVLVFLSPLTLFKEVIDGLAKKPKQPVREWLNGWQSWSTLVFLVWFGHIATSAAFSIVMLVSMIRRAEVQKVREAA